MKYLPYILINLMYVSLAYSNDISWWSKVYRKSGSKSYYTGMAQHKVLSIATKNAYQEAVKEAVRHNFGFNQKYIESFYSTISETKMVEETFLRTDNIQLTGITPGRMHVKTLEDKTHLVYREIIYPLFEIEKEKKRLKKINSKDQTYHNYKLEGKILGKLVVNTIPSGAEIFLNDKKGRRGLKGTGNAIFQVPLGVYFVTVQKKGYYPQKKEVIIGGDKNESSFILKPTSGVLQLDLEPSDTSVYLNNRLVKGNRVKLNCNMEYVIRFEHPDYYNQEEQIEVSPNQTLTINKTLNPRPTLISIITVPDKADVYINDEYVGVTPLTDHEIIKGDYLVRVSKHLYESKEFDIEIGANAKISPYLLNLKYSGNYRNIASHTNQYDPKVTIDLPTLEVNDTLRFGVYFIPGDIKKFGMHFGRSFMFYMGLHQFNLRVCDGINDEWDPDPEYCNSKTIESVLGMDVGIGYSIRWGNVYITPFYRTSIFGAAPPVEVDLWSYNEDREYTYTAMGVNIHYKFPMGKRSNFLAGISIIEQNLDIPNISAGGSLEFSFMLEF